MPQLNLGMGFALLLVGLTAFNVPIVVAQGAILETQYKNTFLIAKPVRRGVKFDVSIVEPREGLNKLRSALDIVFSDSPFSTSRIETLKQNGQVTIVYDPNYPRAVVTTIKVAKFLLTYQKLGNVGEARKNFKVVVSRHGIKWPLRELAAVLVHELVGHGLQRLHGRSEKMRNLDLECEAWLYEERAYQDFKFDKRSREMIQFRKQLEGSGFKEGHCSDFKRHMRINAPTQMKLWESLNPDVPKLLTAFENYIGDLRDNGVTRATLGATR